MDPRVAMIEKRLETIEQLIAVASGKGGVGKSCVAVGLALLLRNRGHRVGLLDLDFYGPSAHLILGVQKVQPQEQQGIVPPWVHGIQFLSIVAYAGENPVPFRGSDFSNAFLELLAITRWDPLTFLIVDMPPGLSDPFLEVVRLLKRAHFLVVTTPSKVARETVNKLILLLTELKVPIRGVVENMRRPHDPPSQPFQPEIPLLGEIPFDERLEEALGVPEQLLNTLFAQKLEAVVSTLLKP